MSKFDEVVMSDELSECEDYAEWQSMREASARESLDESRLMAAIDNANAADFTVLQTLGMIMAANNRGWEDQAQLNYWADRLERLAN